MKTYRLKHDIKHPLFFMAQGTISHRQSRECIYFRTSTGSEFAFPTSHIDEDNDWVEAVPDNLLNN